MTAKPSRKPTMSEDMPPCCKPTNEELFARYSALGEWIERLASTPMNLSLEDWGMFVDEIGNALAEAEHRALAQHDQARPGVETMRPCNGSVGYLVDELREIAKRQPGRREQHKLTLAAAAIARCVANWAEHDPQCHTQFWPANRCSCTTTTIRGGREEIARLALAEAIAGGFVTTRSKGDPDPTKRTASFSVRFSGAGCAQRADAVYDSLQALLALPASIGVEEKQDVTADLSKPQPTGSGTGPLPHAIRARLQRARDGLEKLTLQGEQYIWMPAANAVNAIDEALASDAQSVRPDGGEA